jgi:GDP-mannose 6-dehydrogenase
VSLACLARDGHQVTGVDVDPVKLDLIRSRKSPILEEGIQELMRDVVGPAASR